ncbi:MAG: MerR family transcriptional regulator, partial [Firmicutes bacterium]|nr:MerR family transcriptional regulator [Bacillota bacterium]
MSMKPEPTLFPIGKTAEICGVSARTLRFYEEHGLIHPDKVDNENRYRYYSYDTMRRIQTIRYLLDEGFALAPIQDMLLKDDLNDLKEHFLSQIRET